MESGTAVFTPPANVPEAPLEAGAVKVTVTPVTGLLFASVTRTLSGLEKATPGAAVCGVPLTIVKFAGAPGKLVIVTEPDSAPTVAEIGYWPLIVFGVAVMLATPAALVVAVADDSVALSWPDGAAKVTTTPGTGLADASVTVATKVDAVEEPATRDDGFALSETEAGGVLVNVKVAVPPNPDAVATTV